MKQERTIIHLRFNNSNEDYYYGSLSAIYDDFKSNEIGVALNTLYNFNIDINKVYSNAIVTIKKGTIKTKKKASEV